MSIVLIRIDERLLHGQVLVGWGTRLSLDHYVVIDDELAATPWERELFAAGAPDDVEVTFLSVGEAVEGWARIAERPGRVAVLTRGTGAMRALAEAGLLEGRRVNVGGLHDAPERRRALPYVHLSPGEERDLRAIGARAGSVAARDLPTSPEVPLEGIVGDD